MRAVEKRLRERIKELEIERNKIESDRQKFRHAFISNFKCSVDLLGKGETWRMEYVVKTLAEQLTRFEKWWW